VYGEDVAMAVLGVLCCEILELEFAHLLGNDGEVGPVTVLEDGRSSRLLSRLTDQRGRNISRISSVAQFVPNERGQSEVLLQVLGLGLHIWPKKLRQGLVEAAEEMAPHVDALVLGYGLCGNALEAPAELLSHLGVPIFVPMDEDHSVDDCVGLLIGGRQRYYAEQCKIAGTFFITPGWAFHWRRLLDQEMGGASMDIARRMFEHYERTLLISSPVMSNEEMQEGILEFVETFGLRVETCEGTAGILKNMWGLAKESTGFRTGPAARHHGGRT
jgi:hypothetical protein